MEQLRGGQSMIAPFRSSKVFPPMVSQMMEVGEASGTLGLMMDKAADFIEAEADQLADRLKSAVEPVMTIALAAVVGLIVLAVMLPTFQMFDSMHL